MKYSEQYGTECVRVLTLAQNRGKGGAVRRVSSTARLIQTLYSLMSAFIILDIAIRRYNVILHYMCGC